MPDEPDQIPQIVNLEGNLFRFILSLTGEYEVAEQILERTMSSLLEKWENFRDLEAVSTWAFDLAKNQVRDHIRGQSRKGQVAYLNEAAVELIAAQQLRLKSESETRAETLHECLESLPQEQRDVLRSFYKREEKQVEGIRVVQESLVEFYKSLQRARRLLFACINNKMAANGGS